MRLILSSFGRLLVLLEILVISKFPACLPTSSGSLPSLTSRSSKESLASDTSSLLVMVFGMPFLNLKSWWTFWTNYWYGSRTLFHED